jgi:hypothetical protein
MFRAIHARCPRVQYGLEMAAVQVPPAALGGVVVHAALAPALRTGKPSRRRVLQMHIHSQAVNVHVHVPHRPRCRHAEQLTVELHAVHRLASAWKTTHGAVVPVAVELVQFDANGGQLGIGDDDTLRIRAGVQFGVHGESASGLGAGDEIDDHPVADQGLRPPVHRDEGVWANRPSSARRRRCYWFRGKVQSCCADPDPMEPRVVSGHSVDRVAPVGPAQAVRRAQAHGRIT